MKRIVDVGISIVILILIGPALLVATLFIKLSSRGPIFFYQDRAGLSGQPFRIIKLRTMIVDPNRDTAQTFNSSPDVLPVGRVLRRFKIDELPQILNVLKGDMSLIGPRPCLEKTRDQMPQWAKLRFDVRPGLTGLAQVNGNATLPWEERWRYDVEYVTKLSFYLDVKIIAKTVLVILFGEKRYGPIT